MSLVIRITINNFPLLLGDLLLSGHEDHRNRLTVPTIGEITQIFPPGSGFVPIGLCQKLALIGDNCAIGWAGSQIAAKIIITELREKNRHEPFTNDTLMKFFSEVDQATWDLGVGFVGFIKDPRGIAQFGFRYHDLKIDSFGNVGLLGSGTSFAEASLTSMTDFTKESGQTLNSLQRAYVFGLALSGSLLSHEFSTMQSLSDYFGGGYEIVSLENGRFQKLDEITFFFWYGEINRESVGLNPYQIVKYAYQNDHLLIRSATLEEVQSNKAHFRVNDRVHVVPPILNSATSFDSQKIKKPRMSSKWECNYFVFPRRGGIDIFTHIHYSVQGTPAFRFFEDQNAVRVEMNAEAMRKMLQMACKTHRAA